MTTCIQIKKHFVQFFSPGTFFTEITERELESWDVEKACSLARNITERHDATPFGFRFVTYGRGSEDLDSKMIDSSPMYYLGGKVETLADVEARNDPSEEILRSNMRCNGIARIITNTNSWKFTTALNDGDVVLPWEKEPTV